MPEKLALQRARRAKRRGKSAGSQAGEFVREEMHQLHKGKRAPRSRKQAIAIGLAEARRAGIKVPAKKSARTRKTAKKTSHARQTRRVGRAHKRA